MVSTVHAILCDAFTFHYIYIYVLLTGYTAYIWLILSVCNYVMMDKI